MKLANITSLNTKITTSSNQPVHYLIKKVTTHPVHQLLNLKYYSRDE